VDFSVVQTFSFFNARPAPLARFMASAAKFGVRRIEDIESPVGVAHAYDMTHILAKAIQIAGTTDRAAIRNALEQVKVHDGLVKSYAPPFTATRHEALGTSELLMARYREDGVIVPVGR
jgi:branched-chain amino acid transport system substrate-binding protein